MATSKRTTSDGLPLFNNSAASADTTTDGLPLLKKKVGGGNGGTDGIGGFSTQQNDIQKPVGQISNEQVNAANQQLVGNKDVHTNSNSNQYLQETDKAAKQAVEDRHTQAANNTTSLFYKNNPQLVPENESMMLKNADTKNRGYTFSLKNLPHTTAFQNKAAQIKSDLDNGKLTTYKTDEGELRAAYPMTGLKNTVANLKQAWNASDEADKILNLSDDDFKNYAASKPDNEYLPTKPNEESFSGQVGQGLPIAIKGTAGALAGTALTAVTEGAGIEGLPTIMAWATTAPDMAKTQAAQAKVKAYRDALQQGKSPDEALSIANSMATANYAEGMALGTALTALPNFISKGANEGFLKAFGNHLAMLPYAAGTQGLTAGGLTELKDEYAKHIGLNITDEQQRKDFENSFNGMISPTIMFGVVHGLVDANGAAKAQAKNGISKIPPEQLHQMQDAMVNEGVLTQDQVNDANKSLQDFNNAGKKIIPTGSEEKDAVMKGLIEKRDALKESKTTIDESYHPEIDTQIEDLNNRISLAKNSKDPIKYAEQDGLTGQPHFTPKEFEELTPKEKNNIDVPTDFGKASTKSKGEENVTPIVEVNNQPVKVEGTFTDKDKAQAAADEKLKEIYYNNKLSPLQKPESNEKIKSEEVVTNANNEAGNSSNGYKPADETGKTEKGNGETLQSQQAQVNTTDYRGQHQLTEIKTNASDLQGGGTGFDWEHVAQDHDLSDKSTKESYRVLKSIKDNPDADITIYRSVPKDIDKINEGDWITLSKNYATEHGMDAKDEGKDAPVISMKVKAKDIKWDGNDLNEFVYSPKKYESRNSTNETTDTQANSDTRTNEADIKISPEKERPTTENKPTENPIQPNSVVEGDKNYLPEKIKTETVNPSNPIHVKDIPLSDIVLNDNVRKKVEQHIDKGVNSKMNDAPIVLKYSNDGTLEVLDGAHRVIQAERAGKKTIDAQLINVEQDHEKFEPNPKTNSVVEDKPETENISQPLNTEQGGGKEKVLDDLADVHVEYPPTQLTHGGTERLRGEFGGEDAPKKERESFLETERQANEAIENGYDVNGLLDKMEKENHNPSPKEQFILTKQADLLANQLRDIGKSKGINSPEFDAKLNELDRLNTLSDLAGSRQGKELVSRKFRTINDDSLVGFLLQEKDLNKGADLTEGQKTTAINEYEKINEANDEFQKKYEDLQAKYNKLLAERELKKTQASTAKNTKKTHEDFVKERTDIVKDIREKLKKAREETSVTVVPYAKELIAIAPDVAKLAKSLIEEGIIKLDDIVKNIHGQLKDDVPNLEEKDVHDIIAGVYNEKKKTRSQVAEQMQNLKIQAQLISKYENLLKGSEPKNEKAKIKRNQEIHDLRGKIAGFKAEEREAISDKKATVRTEEKEANTFYGESETGNKRIEKMEDELQRLKERKPKETSPKQQREISDREKELKEQITAERKTIAAEEKEANTRYTENVPDEIKKLNAIKTRNENELKKINQQLKTGDFEPPKKKTPLSQDDELKKNFPQAYKETLASQTKVYKARQERQLRMALRQFDNLSARQKFAKNAVRYLNVPRTLMASMDYSAPLRQGLVATVAHPFTAAKAFAIMFKHGWSQEAFDRFYHEIHESPRWQLYQDSKLALTDPHSLHLNAQEEAFLGGNVAEKIPVLGKGVKASERAYVSYLNKMRIDLFDRFADAFEEDGKTYSNSPELYKALANYINSATGRGDLGFADAAAPLLNTVLFSPRLIASRINMLTNWMNPNFYRTVPKAVRVLYFQDMAKFIGVGVSFLALAKYGFGANVELDPRSSDFGKIKVGNTRWDIWGGFQQYIRVLAQLMTGQRKSQAAGIKDIDKQFGQNRLDILYSFGRGKLAPIPSMTADILGGRTSSGQKINRNFDWNSPQGEESLTDEAINHLVPLIGSDVYAAMKEQGAKAIFTVGIPSTFGVGVQTYALTPTKSKTSKTQVRQTPKRQVIQHS